MARMLRAAECMVQDIEHKVFKENTVVDAIWAIMVVLTYFYLSLFMLFCFVGV